jgi:hypothetical protein
MITIIICSIDPERCSKLLENISETVGVEYEALVFDNRNEQWGLCRVYNHCAEKAKYPYLCFMHEDVHIDTKNWGEKIVGTVEKIPDCGVVGFAGGIRAAKNISSWWAGGKISNIYDGFNGKNYPYRRLNYATHYYSNPYAEEISNVLCVDGLFQFIKKSIWEEIRYDERLFAGFHFYDIDFSFAVAEKYNNYVLLDLDVFHDSGGRMNADYVRYMFVFQNKWKNRLPKKLDDTMLRRGNIKFELAEAFFIFTLCVNNRVNLRKYLAQLYKINRFPVFVLLLFYIPMKVVLKLFCQVIEKI